jgi:hypothetical protein
MKLLANILQTMVTNFVTLIVSQPLLANPTNLKYLKISHPTINTYWLSWGKFQVFQIFRGRLLIPIAFLNNG